jgi:hypothetical protein
MQQQCADAPEILGLPYTAVRGTPATLAKQRNAMDMHSLVCLWMLLASDARVY